MTSLDHAKFTGMHASGALVPPHAPGGVLAGLALKAAPALSGTFVSWDAEEMAEYTLV